MIFDASYLARMSGVASLIKEMEEDERIVGIGSRGVHLTAKAFSENFGTDEATKELTMDYIHCTTKVNGVDFFALFKIPKGVTVIDGPTTTVKYVNLHEVELIP